MKFESKIDIAKSITSAVVGGSTTFTVNRIIANNVTTETRPEKIKAYIGSFVIGAVVAEQTKAYTDRQIDKIAASWKDWTEHETND